jgi:transcriptional regulator with XRE-family HTH domain
MAGARSIEHVEHGWRELGEAIRRRRRVARLSQEELAEQSGLHRTYLSEIETSKVKPSIYVLRKIADALGVRASQLVAEAEDAGET